MSPFPPPPMPSAELPRYRTLRTVCRRVGLAIIVLALLGCVHGVTAEIGHFVAHGQRSYPKPVDASALANLLHVVFGVMGVALSRRVASARAYLVVGGGLYLLIAVYGGVVAYLADDGHVGVLGPGDWLHVGIGIVMIAFGTIFGRSAGEASIGSGGPTRNTPTG